MIDENDITRVRQICERLSKNINPNPFSILSEGCVQLENFHSKVIAALIDPKARHNRWSENLQAFLSWLQIASPNEDQQRILGDLQKVIRNDRDVSVCVDREHSANVDGKRGRIDILITIGTRSGKKSAIIIENKMNDAPDMDNQLPRYVKSLKDDVDIVAVVYIKAFANKPPALQKEWEELLSNKLIAVSACMKDDKKSLVEGWLKEILKDNSDECVKQYIEFITHQCGDEKDWNDLARIYAICHDEFDDAFKNDPKVMSVVERLPGQIEVQLLRSCSKGGFANSVWWRKSKAAFHGLYLDVADKSIELGVDVCLQSNKECYIELFVREDRDDVAKELFGTVAFDINAIDKDFKLHRSRGNRGVTYKIKLDFMEICGDVEATIDRVSSILQKTSERKIELSAAVSRGANKE